MNFCANADPLRVVTDDPLRYVIISRPIDCNKVDLSLPACSRAASECGDDGWLFLEQSLTSPLLAGPTRFEDICNDLQAFTFLVLWLRARNAQHRVRRLHLLLCCRLEPCFRPQDDFLFDRNVRKSHIWHRAECSTTCCRRHSVGLIVD
jgi:hypothetical protein